MKDVEKPLGKNPNAVSAIQRLKNLGDLRSPTAPPASTGTGRREAAEVTPLSRCAVNSFPGNRQAHRPPRAADCLPARSLPCPANPRLVRPELDTVEFFNGFKAKRFSFPCSTAPQPKSATSFPALHLPNQTCDDGDKPA